MSTSRGVVRLFGVGQFALVVGVSAWLVACGNEAQTDESGGLADEVAPAPVVEPPPPPVPERDASGALLPSDVVVAGLPLPRGVHETESTERHHAYESAHTAAALARYFGARLITGRVDQYAGGGVHYASASVREPVGGNGRPLEVTISPIAEGSLIVIDELLPANAVVGSDEEARAAILEAIRNGQ